LYRPRCPQVAVDVGHLLRIPADIEFPIEPEDEYRCLNLDITTPSIESGINVKLLPVLIWIHGMSSMSQERRMLITRNRPGGSQTVTFGSAASKVCG
jgi:hypothetical protein